MLQLLIILKIITTFADKVEIHHHNSNLTDDDLNPASIWAYLKTIIFLLAILIFWILCGGFANYALPFDRIFILMGSCFRGKLSNQLVSWQQEIANQSIGDLTQSRANAKNIICLDAEISLFIELLEKLDIQDTKSRQKISKLVNNLEQKRNKITEYLKDNGHHKYLKFRDIQQTFNNSFSTSSARDYQHIEQAIAKVAEVVESAPPTDTANTILEKIKDEFIKSASTVNSRRLPTIEKLFNTAKILLLKQFNSNIQNLLLQNQNLNTRIQQLENLLEDQEKSLQYLSEYNKTIQNENDNLKHRHEVLRQQIQHFRQQKQYDERQISQLSNKLQELEASAILDKNPSQWVDSLIESGKLQGKYLGNIQRKGKYHFSSRCPDWQSLFCKYVFEESLEQKIISSNNPKDLQDSGLKPCGHCQKYQAD
ncbi:MAG: hypothetical protein ACLFV6_01680 [Spirulinaceae cyanobacterium]